MEEKYVVRTDKEISQPVTRSEAINMVKDYSKQGISAYIVSQDESQRIKDAKFNKPEWK